MNNTLASAAIEKIDAMVAERSLLLHPFYQAWTQGRLSQSALQDYARQYYHHVAAFPTYLSAVHSGADDMETRKHILANLNDEEAGHPNHPELWLQFAEGLGLSREETLHAELQPETQNLISAFHSVCREGGTAEGLAALYAYESQVPAVAESKIDGLRNFYGISAPEATAYFQVHITADREHSAVERKLLEKHIDGENSARALESVDTVLTALWQMLSGVCRRHAIAC